MEQKMRAPKLSTWLIASALLLAVVSSAYGWSINPRGQQQRQQQQWTTEPTTNDQDTGLAYARANFKGCVQKCSKLNSIFQNQNRQSTFSSLSGLFRKTRSVDDQEGEDLTSVQFELGKTYQYRVQTTNEARTLFAIGEHSQNQDQDDQDEQNTRDQLIEVQATALITPVSECEVSMQLKNVKLNVQNQKNQQEDEQEEEVRQLIRKLQVPILFQYENGVISEVCTDLEEDTFAVNLKKGIISALQTTPQLVKTERVKVVESDVNGECETDYSVEQESSSKFTVRKHKSLGKCVDPAEQADTISSWKSALLKYNPDAVVKCQQSIEQRQLQTAQCQSVRTINTLLPHFGVELVSSVELEAEQIYSADQRAADVPKRFSRHAHRLMMSRPETSLFGDMKSKIAHKRVHHQELQDGRVQLKNVLDQICEEIQQNDRRVSIKTAQYVHQLADTLRQSSQQDVQFVWQNIIKQGSICRDQSKKMKDIFLSTAASVMDQNSAEIVREELVKYIERAQQNQDQEALQKAEKLAQMVVNAFAPTPEAVRSVLPELLEKIDNTQIVLALSTLVQKVKEDLQTEDARLLESLYETVLRKVYARLAKDIRREEANIIRLFAALENIEPQTQVAGQERLVKIATDSRLPVSIRVASVKSWEQIEMEPTLRKTLLQLFADGSESNELRIAAYRTLVASEVTKQELKQILAQIEQEQDQDVHNYVCSHQKNLRTTDDLKKRALLPLDAPLFPEPQSLANFALARNFDYSFVNPKTQVGSFVEADLILEKESRVPKSVTFNFTMEIAEQKIQQVQIAVRQQGLERSFLEKLNQLKQLKSPRVILRQLTKMVREQKQPKYNEQDKDSKIQVILTVEDANVLMWDSAENQQKEQQFESMLERIYKELPIEIDETTVMMRLKHEVRLPTSAGIPMKYQLNMTVISSLETRIKGAQQNGLESNLEMHIKPTFVIEQGVALVADISAHKTKRVQYVSRFITAPTLHLKTQLKRDQIRMKVLLPESEQIVARFETEFTNEKSEQVQLFNSLAPGVSGLQREMRKALHNRQQLWYRASSRDGQQSEQCLPVLDQLMGFTYCMQQFTEQDLKNQLASSEARKLIYLTQVKLVKTDSQMEGIEFGVELAKGADNSSDNNEFKFALHYDTPNSRVNRRFNTDLVIRIPQQSQGKMLVQLEIDSPLKKVSGQAVLINTEQQKGLKIELTTDRDQRQFLLDANALIAVQDRTNTQVKFALRLQPSAQAQLSELEGELSLQGESDSKQKAELKLVANEKEVLRVDFVKAGFLTKPVDLKMSATFKLDLLGAKVEASSLVNKNQQTGTLKSTGQVKYNRFFAFSRRSRSSEETVAYQFQYSGFNPQLDTELKQFVHWQLQSSQFPALNQELTYNIKGQIPEEFTQEFKLKWDAEEKNKLIRFVHEQKQLQNARVRTVKHQSQVELEITPLNVHYETQLILDLSHQLPQEPTKSFGVELKSLNRKTSEIAVEGRFVYKLSSRKPFQVEAEGELKLNNGEYKIQGRETIDEVSRGVYQAKTVIELPEDMPSKLSFLPKKIVRTATYKKLETPVERIRQIDGAYLRNAIARLVNKFEQVEQELILEDESRIRLHSIVVANEQNEWQIKSELERNQQPLYKTEAEIIPHQRALKIKFEAEKLDQLQVEIDAQLKGENKKVDVKVENRQMQHQTRIQADKQEKKLELTCMTKQNQQVVFELDAKKQDSAAQLKIKSRLVEAEIELDNVHSRFVRSMLKKRSIYGDQEQQDETQAKILVKLPTKDLEHKTEIAIKPAARQLNLATETRKEERNLFKAQLQLRPEEKSIDAEYKVGYIAKVKLAKQSEDVYEFTADYRVEPKQWVHKTQAKWQYSPKSLISRRTNAWEIPAPLAQFRLISLEMKNHLGPKNVFDLTYKCNEQNPSAEYAHQFFVSTRDTHAELQLSELSQQDNQQRSPKILFTLKSKKFGGVEHKTELKEVNVEKRQMKLYSNTVAQGEVIAQVECELALKRGQQSRVKVQAANGYELEAQVVPFESLDAKVDYANVWSHEIKADRKADQKQWTVKVESLNKRKSQKWNVQTRHQCDEYTTVELDTPVLRGQIEVRLDETKKVHIELKGDRKWAGMEHKTDAVWQPEQDKVAIKSVTLKQGKPFVFVDAELVASLERASSLKVEIEPVEVKVAIEVDPKVGGELQLNFQEWKHQMQIKKRSSQLTIHSETRKDNEQIVLVESELSPRKVEVKCELAAIKKFSPLSLKGKLDIDTKEMHFAAHHKRSDRKVKLEAKMRDLKNIHFDFAWDAARDQSKQVMVQIAVQDKQADPERFVASVRGDIVNRPFEIKIDVPRQTPGTNGQWIQGSHHIEAELKNRQTNEQYIVKYIRKYQPGQKYQSWIEMRKNDFTIFKSDLTVKHAQDKKVVELKTESDYKFDILNVNLELTRECAYKQCETKATAVYGSDDKKEIKVQCSNLADAIRGQIVIDAPRFRAQTIKFEYIKPESKLQVNVFNQAGRQLDLNVDLARPLQKKFQIESFIESIPTVDIEAAHGENSRLVVAVSFQQEKKMELAINWFGQWRRDFKLEALFKCFSKPSIEMLITSRHPEGADEFDAMLKVAANEYVAKWTRKFDEDKDNWNTNTLIKVNGEKKVDLRVEATTKQVDSRREIKTFKAQLDGVKRATGQVTVAINKQSAKMVEMIQCELTNKKQERMLEFNLYLAVRDEQQSAIRTGIKLAINEKPVFGLVHHANERASGEQKRTSMIRLELPDQIEYVLRNEIEYEPRNPEEIKSIRSELKKRQQTIYKTRVYFTEDRAHDMKVMRIEVHSAQFEQPQVPKIIEVRYNFEPKQCKTLHLQHFHHHEQQQERNSNKQQRSFAFSEGQTECWQVEILAGSAQQQQQNQEFDAEKEYDIKIGAQYVKYPIDNRHFNRTIRFEIKSNNNQDEQELITLEPIDFTVVGHISRRSAGLVWDNHNRHGQHKSGMWHAELERQNSGRSMVNVYVRNQNRRQPSKDVSYDLHFEPSQLRKSMRMNAKWDQERLRRWIVGEIPALKDMMRGEMKMKAMKNRMMREIRDEFHHKLAYLKENYNNELVRPIMQEAEQVQQQMMASEEKMARAVTKMVKRAAAKVEQIYESVDLGENFDEFVLAVSNAIQKLKRETTELIVEKCQKSKTCRKIVEQIRDYEIEKFVQKEIVDRLEEAQEKLKRVVPEELLESVEELAREFHKAHQEDDDEQDNETEDDENQQQQQKKHKKTANRWMRHGARLLKMSQPKMSESFMKHMSKVSNNVWQQQEQDQSDDDQDDDELDFDLREPEQYKSKHAQRRAMKKTKSEDQMKIDWPEVRGALHDMAVDMMDKYQQKSNNNSESKPFWSQFMAGGNGQQKNTQQTGAGSFGGYASEYASKWTSKNQKKSQHKSIDNDDDDDNDGDNFVFNAKRGEFKLMPSKSSSSSSSGYWTRA